MLRPIAPVNLVPLFPGLHSQLMTLLRGLSPEDWNRPTACPLWSVKDIVAHLLDTCLRRLSFGRDHLDPSPDRPITAYGDLVVYLNELNARWVAATRRLSPGVLIDIMDLAGPQLHQYFSSLDPQNTATFGVAWAGQEESPVWFDIGREYTERWLHQQQIREAVGADGLVGRQWLHPALDIFVRALPYTYRQVQAEPGASIELEIRGEAGGLWTLARAEATWVLFTGREGQSMARVRLDQDAAWKLFSKGLSPDQASQRVVIEGDPRLGRPVLGTLAVMA
jgi:uncharacterized protein (TIGR03083 family)